MDPITTGALIAGGSQLAGAGIQTLGKGKQRTSPLEKAQARDINFKTQLKQHLAAPTYALGQTGMQNMLLQGRPMGSPQAEANYAGMKAHYGSGAWKGGGGSTESPQYQAAYGNAMKPGIGDALALANGLIFVGKYLPQITGAVQEAGKNYGNLAGGIGKLLRG